MSTTNPTLTAFIDSRETFLPSRVPQHITDMLTLGSIATPYTAAHWYHVSDYVILDTSQGHSVAGTPITSPLLTHAELQAYWLYTNTQGEYVAQRWNDAYGATHLIDELAKLSGLAYVDACELIDSLT